MGYPVLVVMKPTALFPHDPSHRRPPTASGVLAGFLLIATVPLVLVAVSHPLLFAALVAALGLGYGIRSVRGPVRCRLPTRAGAPRRLCVPGTGVCIDLSAVPVIGRSR